MIHYYGVTQQGAYHIRNNIICQDHHAVKVLGEHFSVAAVADGLGSELYSDVASKIAAEKSIDYVCQNINEGSSAEDIIKIIKDAFSFCLNKINNKAKEDGNDADQYDTTLALAVYRNGIVYFGNSGDSGIVVMNTDGTFEPITTQQRDQNGCVFPLYFGEEKWEFGVHENAASVFLATDGMYETLFPYLLKGENISIYTALANYMMSSESLNFSEFSDEDVQKRMEEFIGGIPGDQVSDDKTVVVMLDQSVSVSRQPDEYYRSPDWAALKKKRDEEYKKAAYPHLFGDNNQQTEEN